MDLGPDQLNSIRVIMCAICPFSIITNACVIFLVLFNRRHQSSFVNRLQAYLSFTDIIVSMDWMLGTSILSIVPFCTAVGLWHEYFAVSGTCFVFCISLLCYLTVTQGSKAAEAMKWWYFVYALGLPALFTLALVMSAKILDRGNMIGDATFECWISGAYPELKLVLLYPLVWIHMVAVIVMYFRIYTLTRVATSGLHEVYKSNGHSTQDPSQVTNMNGSIHGSSILLSPASIPCLIASTSPRLSQAVNSDNMVPQENHGIIQETTMNNLRKMRESTHRLILKASLIAAGFIITWTPATITRIMQLLGEPVPFSLFVCMGVCFASTGLLNSGVFLIMLLLKQGK